jgi:hypothetical protein
MTISRRKFLKTMIFGGTIPALMPEYGMGKSPRQPMNLPPGGGTLYAAQTVCVDFHSFPDEGAASLLPAPFLFNRPTSIQKMKIPI